MALCKAKQIQNCCLPNALLTLEEYLSDYASADTKRIGEALIERNFADITNPKVLAKVKDELSQIRSGEGRDFRF